MFLAERWESCLINVDDESSKVFLRCRRTEMRICLLTIQFKMRCSKYLSRSVSRPSVFRMQKYSRTAQLYCVVEKILQKKLLVL